jgi:hypothetical protein
VGLGSYTIALCVGNKWTHSRSNGYANQHCQPLDKMSPSQYAKNLLQGDYTSQSKESEIRHRRIEAAWEPKRIGRLENSERRLQKTDRHGRHSLCLIVKVIYVRLVKCSNEVA